MPRRTQHTAKTRHNIVTICFSSFETATADTGTDRPMFFHAVATRYVSRTFVHATPDVTPVQFCLNTTFHVIIRSSDDAIPVRHLMSLVLPAEGLPPAMTPPHRRPYATLMNNRC